MVESQTWQNLKFYWYKVQLESSDRKSNQADLGIALGSKILTWIIFQSRCSSSGLVTVQETLHAEANWSDKHMLLET